MINPMPASKERKISIIVVMGVSGSGKTTIGIRLAQRLGWDYIESDDYHSEQDVQKMSNGIPLTDEDRQPWLDKLHQVLTEFFEKNQPVVMACSALKERYRQQLIEGIKDASVFIYLKGDFDLIWIRMKGRRHFMKAELLQSQFDALEEPPDAITVNMNKPIEEIMIEIIHEINSIFKMGQQ